MNAPPARASTDRTPSAAYLVLVLAVAYALSFMDRTILSLLVQPIKRDLGLTDTELSLLHGFAFAIFYTTLGIPIGRLADHRSRRHIVAAGIALWSVMTTACGLAQSYLQLFLLRVGVGVGEAALSPAAYSMIADAVPASRTGRAIGAYSMGVYVGSGLAFIIGGTVVGLVSRTGGLALPLVGTLRPWQLAFLVVGLPGLLVAGWALTLREPPRRGVVRGQAPPPLREVAAWVRARASAYGAHFAGFSLLSLAFNAFVAWAPSVLIRNFPVSHAQAGLWLGTGILLLGSAGIWAGGWLADALTRRGYRDATLRVGIVSGIGLTPCAVLAPLMPTSGLAVAFFWCFAFFGSFGFGAAAAGLQLVTPNNLRGQVSALYLFLINLVGIGAGPTLTALLTDRVFGSEADVRYALALVAGTCAPLAALVLLRGLRAFREAALATPAP